MGLFSKSCPLEKSHLAVYGVHSPRKWRKEDCQTCQYQQDNKCSYKLEITKIEQAKKLGYPAFIKKSMMDKAAAERQKAEKEALQKAGFSPDQQSEYWEISQEYERLWTESVPEKRADILDSLAQWKVYLEQGSSPGQAQEKVKEWLRQREEFRRQ
jgi:hypothetical protein